MPGGSDPLPVGEEPGGGLSPRFSIAVIAMLQALEEFRLQMPTFITLFETT